MLRRLTCPISRTRSDTTLLDLTREQLEAAEACGCALLPATEAQVGRLTPQRRIFRLDGRPFVARRPDGFLETHAHPRAADRGPAPHGPDATTAATWRARRRDGTNGDGGRHADSAAAVQRRSRRVGGHAVATAAPNRARTGCDGGRRDA